MQPGIRTTAEALTSAIIIYVHEIEQKLAGTADDDDDQSEDEEQFTGPGSLLFPLEPPSSPVTSSSSKLVSFKDGDDGAPKSDAASWIYDSLRDRIKEGPSRASKLPSHFVNWLLEEAIDTTKPEEAPAKATSSELGAVASDKPAAETATEAAAEAATEPSATPNTKKASDSKKKAKTKGKAAQTEPTPTGSESLAEKSSDVKAGQTAPDTAKTGAGDSKDTVAAADPPSDAIKAVTKDTDDTMAKTQDSPAVAHAVPEAPGIGEAQASPKQVRHVEPEKSKDAKFGRFDFAHDHDDLPPPYPSPEGHMPSIRRPPFGGVPFAPPQMAATDYPFPPRNPMAYQSPDPFESYSSMAYMPPQPTMFHPVGFYPMHPSFLAPQPFYGGFTPPTNDAFGLNDQYGSRFPGRPFQPKRRDSMNHARQDSPQNGGASRSGGMVRSRRPAGTIHNGAIFGRPVEEELHDEEEPKARHRSPQAMRRKESEGSRSGDDGKNLETAAKTKKKVGEDTASLRDKMDEGAKDSKGKAREISTDHAGEDGEPSNASPKERKSSGSSNKSAKLGDSTKDDPEFTDGVKDQSKEKDRLDGDVGSASKPPPPTANSSGKLRNNKVSKGKARENKPPSPSSVSRLPTPPTPPSEPEEQAPSTGDVGTKDETSDDEIGKTEPEERRADRDPKGKGKDIEKHNSTTKSSKKDPSKDLDEPSFSPSTEPRVMTPPPTPQQNTAYPKSAPHPPPAAHNMPRAQQSGPRGARGTYAHNAAENIPYMQQASFAPAHPLLATNPFIPRPGGARDAAGFSMNSEFGMGLSMGMGVGMAAGALDPRWSSRGDAMPSAPYPWATTAAAAAAAAASAGMAGYAAPQGGFGMNWARGEGNAMPPLGGPPPVPQRDSQQWSRYRERVMEDDFEELEEANRFGHSDDYGHDDDDDDDEDDHFRYSSEDMRRRRNVPYAERRRSHSPPYQRQAPAPPPPRDHREDFAHGGHVSAGDPRSRQQQQQQQQARQQPYTRPPYYDRPQRPSFDDEPPSEWGWADGGASEGGGFKEPPPFSGPAKKGSVDSEDGGYDNWHEMYRRSRGHAEYEMTDIGA